MYVQQRIKLLICAARRFSVKCGYSSEFQSHMLHTYSTLIDLRVKIRAGSNERIWDVKRET